MSIEITETIIKRVQVQLPAETMEELITKAALDAAGIKPSEGVIVKAIGFATKVEITQEIVEAPIAAPAIAPVAKTAPPPAIKSAAPVRKSAPSAQKAASATIKSDPPAAWTSAEDDLIIQTAAAMGSVARSHIAKAVSMKLTHRTVGAIEFRLKTKLEAKISAAKVVAPSSHIDQPAATEPVVKAAAAIALAPRSNIQISPDLAAHIKALPKVEGWALADDAELMDRVMKNQNTAVIAAGMEREAAFVIQRVDRLLGRKKGGAVTYGRQAVATALAELAAIAKEAVQ